MAMAGDGCSVAQVMDLDKPYFSEQRMVQPYGFLTSICNTHPQPRNNMKNA